jgi:hypothetical protein
VTEPVQEDGVLDGDESDDALYDPEQLRTLDPASEATRKGEDIHRRSGGA